MQQRLDETNTLIANFDDEHDEIEVSSRASITSLANMYHIQGLSGFQDMCIVSGPIPSCAPS